MTESTYLTTDEAALELMKARPNITESSALTTIRSRKWRDARRIKAKHSTLDGTLMIDSASLSAALAKPNAGRGRSGRPSTKNVKEQTK